MASGTITGSNNGQVQCKISWSSSKGTGGSTVNANLIAQNINGYYFYANVYYGYSVTINGDSKSGSGGALSSAANGAVTLLSHSVWVGYTGNKSITISGSINLTGILNGGTVSGSSPVALDMVGSAPAVPTCTAPSTQVFSELGGTITIRWNKPSSYTESGAGYWVDVQINNGAWSNIATINNFNTLSYNYTIPAGQGGTYRFRVGAWNPVGNAGNHGYSGIVTRNSISAPSIGSLSTFNPYVTSTFTVPLSGGSQANGGSFMRRADVYMYNASGTMVKWFCGKPSNGNTSIGVGVPAADVINALGASRYSATITVIAWNENGNGSRSGYVEKSTTVNINSDGAATPTLSAPTISGGILGATSTCFVSGVNGVGVTSATAALRRAPSGTTISYKIECTGASTLNAKSGTFNGLSSGTKTIKVTATDSRGLSASSSVKVVVQSWSAPRITITSCDRVSSATTTAKLVYSMTYSPIYTYPSVSTQGTQLNSISLQQYNINGGSWTTASNNMTISGLSNELTYVINMRCADKVKTTTYSTAYITVPTVNSLLSLRKWGCGINCIPQNGYALDVTGKSRVGGDFVIGAGKTAAADGKSGIYFNNGDGSVELCGASPYIDFCYGNSTSDYKQRIHSTASGLNIYSDTSINLYTNGSTKKTTIDASGNLSVNGISATAEIAAKKLTADYTFQRGYLTSPSQSGETNNMWTKMASFDITGQYGDANGSFVVEWVGNGDGLIYRAEVTARVKQQNPMGQAPYTSLYVDGINVSATNFALVKVTNTSSVTSVQLWARNFVTWSYMIFYYVSSSGNVTLNSASAYQAALPSGLMQYGTDRLLNRIYPVGSIYITTSGTNPSDFLGGTWVEYAQGCVLVGYNGSDGNFNSMGKTGGESTHTLSVNEIPNHRHDQNVTAATFASTGVRTDYNADAKSAPFSQGVTTASTGGGAAHNNLQPYVVVKFFRRTA